MRRVCYCEHPVPNSGGTSSAGHVLGISLKCQEEKCKFATKPVHMNLLSLADRRLANHIASSHPKGVERENISSSESHEAIGKRTENNAKNETRFYSRH